MELIRYHTVITALVESLCLNVHMEKRFDDDDDDDDDDDSMIV